MKHNNQKQQNIKPKLILYELNEVPLRLLKLYIQNKPLSALAKVYNNGQFFKTITKDDGELHPWSTWPTVHRGVPNAIHNIRFINQDLSQSISYKPVWEILSENGISVGVFGSLQSYPPLLNKNVLFHLPDTFAPNEKSYPKILEVFQSFNLMMAGDNKAVSRPINIKNIVVFLKLFIYKLVSFKLLIKVIKHLVLEVLRPEHKKRRSIFQAHFTFELYLKFLKKYQPSFSTYFTNHVAGMMHRYWKYVFPEDFGLEKDLKNSFKAKSVIKAMDIVDSHLKELIKISNANNYNLLVVSSMGQDSIDRGKYIPEPLLIDFKKFIKFLDLNILNFELLPAMQPDICVECKDIESLNEIREKIRFLTDSQGLVLLKERYEPIGLKLNLSVQRTSSIAENKQLIYLDKRSNLFNVGFELLNRDIGTAYHIPEGIMMYYGKPSKSFYRKNDEVLDSCRITPSILEYFGLSSPDYMQSSIQDC